jgi:hypothetical protein
MVGRAEHTVHARPNGLLTGDCRKNAMCLNVDTGSDVTLRLNVRQNRRTVGAVNLGWRRQS